MRTARFAAALLLIGPACVAPPPSAEDAFVVVALSGEIRGACALAAGAEAGRLDDRAAARITEEAVRFYEELPLFDQPPGFTPAVREGIARVCRDAITAYRQDA